MQRNQRLKKKRICKFEKRLRFHRAIIYKEASNNGF